jgi:signal transduction histidine kinase
MGVGRDLRGRRRDGSEFPVEIGLTPIETGDGWAVLGTIVDITERTEAQERERLRLAEMAHALRLSTVGEMFSGLAHEVNQPLAAAANYARTCIRYARSEQGIDRRQLLDWMEKTAAQTARAIEIVQRVGTFVRKERSKYVQLDLNSIIREVIALPGLATAVLEVASTIVPDLQLEKSLPPVLADRVQIEQVLLNLLRNAIESMVNMPPRQRKLTIRTSLFGAYAEVAVSDEGHGISSEDLAKLFNPFFTTKPDGMGLGLSISRSIIEAHSGQMSADSKVGVGTTFRFTLPIATAEAKP